MELVKTQCRLMAIGGGEDKKGDCRILKEFVRLAGAEKAKIVIMTTATDFPGEVAKEYIKVFESLGVKDVRHIDVSERLDAMRPASIEAVTEASGVFFTGGDQLHITSLMGGTDLHKAITDCSRKELFIGGTSAGAAMMGNSMIIDGRSDENPRAGAVEIGPGTDLIVGCIIDTHFPSAAATGAC